MCTLLHTPIYVYTAHPELGDARIVRPSPLSDSGHAPPVPNPIRYRYE